MGAAPYPVFECTGGGFNALFVTGGLSECSVLCFQGFNVCFSVCGGGGGGGGGEWGVGEH